MLFRSAAVSGDERGPRKEKEEEEKERLRLEEERRRKEEEEKRRGGEEDEWEKEKRRKKRKKRKGRAHRRKPKVREKRRKSVEKEGKRPKGRKGRRGEKGKKKKKKKRTHRRRSAQLRRSKSRVLKKRRKEEEEEEEALTNPYKLTRRTRSILRTASKCAGHSDGAKLAATLRAASYVAAREFPREVPVTFLGEDARGSRNVVEKPTCIPIAPVDERSDRRSPSGTNSHRFNSSPSTLIFEILSHVFDIINIGKTWEQIGQHLLISSTP